MLEIVLGTLGIDIRRVALEWVSAAEAPRFVEKIASFTRFIRELGPLGNYEGLDPAVLMRKIEAARMTLSGMKMRMDVARQAKHIKNEGTYGEFPAEEKLRSTFRNEMTLYETWLCLRERERPASELAEMLAVPEERIAAAMETLKKKKLWPGGLSGQTWSEKGEPRG